MAIQRFLYRWTLFSIAVFLIGCDSDQPAGVPLAESPASAIIREPVTADDFLVLAKRLHQSGDHTSAADAVNKALIQEPESVDAKWLAAQVEAARGNSEAAAEIAASIALDSRMGRPALELRVKLLVQLDRPSEAADVILAALDEGVELPQWRNQAWSLLNQSGRREEASNQALALCRAGLATDQQLLSLISRTLSFPTPGMLEKSGGGDDADRSCAPGLPQARWYFSLGEYRRALDELAEQSESGFENAAAEALYGRLLSESQQWEELRQWNLQSSPQAKELGDYWAAIGTFFLENRRHEAATRALLEAVRRNPTDRICIQRLSKVFYALQRPEDGDQYRYRGVDISQTERLAEELSAAPNDIDTRKNLTRYVMELGRPFETLAWTLTTIPTNAVGQRRAITQQRAALLRNPRAMVMASESSFFDLDPDDFDMDLAWQELLTGKALVKTRPAVKRQAIAASPKLVNRAKEMGLDFQWYKDIEIDLDSIPIHESLGGGIAVLDYDLDGWPDVYVGQGSGDPPTDKCTRSSQLFRLRDHAFGQVTTLAGVEDYHYSSGLAAGDVNQDGFPDLFLGSLGHNRLLVNNGDGTFRDATAEMGDFSDRFTTSLGIADINGDGLPDLFEGNYIEMEGAFALPKMGPDGRLISPTPLAHYAESDRWLENLGDGRFTIHEITREVAKPATTLGLVITDFDSDGKNDVFVGNDVRPNHFLIQSGKNQFVNLADSNGLANGLEGAANGCMGIATGDFNRDGMLDLQIANYAEEAANLYMQVSAGSFSDLSVRYGLDAPTRTYVGFGTKAVDIDRNGFLDFIVANGHIFDLRHDGQPYQMSPQLFLSDGQSFQLRDVEDESGYWAGTYLGRTIATLDYDRDGALDFLVSHLDQPLALLHDETKTGGSWLQLELVGTTSERDAIGAKVTFRVGASTYTQWVTAGDGYFCSDEPLVSFAFPESDRLAELEIEWPSGTRQTFQNVDIGNRYLVIEGEPGLQRRP